LEKNPPVVGAKKNYIIANIEEPEMENMTEEEKEYRDFFNEELKRERNSKKETYLEYFYENRKGENRKTVKFEITNDFSDDVFIKKVRSNCEKINRITGSTDTDKKQDSSERRVDKIPKDDMYVFKLNKGKTFKIKFANDQDLCEKISTVEIVVTYYKPKNSNNKILDNFIDACSRIVDHMGNLKRMNGELLILDKNKTKYNTLLKNVFLLHKPSTNLYYMVKPENSIINDVVFVPQMTFRCHAIDAVDIMKEITKYTPKYEKSIYGEIFEQEEMYFVFLEEIVDNILKTTKIDTSTVVGKKIKSYYFLILYKLESFINNAHDIIVKEKYFKNFLHFNSRHYNIHLYKRIKYLVKKNYDSSQLKLLFHQPASFEKLYDFETKNKLFQKDAFQKILPKTDKNYGNPLYSIDSYFKYLEEKDVDWLYNEGHDTYSTTFDMKSDIILIEHRSFHIQLITYLKYFVDKRIIDTNKKNFLYLDEMKRMVAKLYDKSKIKNMENYDFINNRLTKKCKKGFLRKTKSVKCAKGK
jgi:hypothetical protein